MKERRKQFLIDKPLQFRYMSYIASILLIISTVILVNLYFGIWGGILDAFSNEKTRNDLLLASRLSQYEEARVPAPQGKDSALSFFKQAEKLSLRQREVFKEILDETNRKLLQKYFILLLLIAWATIYLSHKIAGPLHHFKMILDRIGQGDLRVRIHLRKFDEAQALADQLNDTLKNLDKTLTNIKAIARDPRSDPQHTLTRLNQELSKIKTSADR